MTEQALSSLITFHSDHAQALNVENFDPETCECSLINFSALCRARIAEPDDENLLEKIKAMGKIAPKEMTSQLWYPLATKCDIVTYFNASNPSWVDALPFCVESLEEKKETIDETMLGNLARIAITYACDARGELCSKALVTLLLS